MIEDLVKSLTELEGEDWGSSDDESYIIRNCTNLRNKALGEFNVEDLRIMIGQNIGIKYLLPIAIEKLDINIFSEGMHYPGDLLCSVLRASPKFYEENPEMREKLISLISAVNNQLHELNEIDLAVFKNAFVEALQ